MRFLTHLAGSALLIVSSLSSCNQTPQVVYDESADSTQQLIVDPEIVQIAGLPMHFDSTEFLIHPIGPYRLNASRSKLLIGSYESGSSSSGISIGYFSGNSCNGEFDNLKFQHIQQDELMPLTTETIKIWSVQFLRSIYNATQRQVLLYNVTDKDSDKNHYLDRHDLESLYISNIDGTGFKRLTPDGHELSQHRIVDVQHRLYFTTMEDVDKDGFFTNADAVHYFYVDFDEEGHPVKEYFPLETS